MSRKKSGCWKRPKLEIAWRRPKAIPSEAEPAREGEEALLLLLVERFVLGEGHHDPFDPDRLPGCEIAHEGRRLAVRDANPSDPRVDADVDTERLLARGREAVENVSNRSVDHRGDIGGRRIFQVLRVEGTHEQDRLSNARVAKRGGLRELHDRERMNGFRGLEEPGHVRDSRAVAVVLDDGEDRPSADALLDLRHVVGEVLAMDFDPRVEGRDQALGRLFGA